MYNYVGDPRQINKNIPTYSAEGTNVFEAYMNTSCDILYPTITIGYSDGMVNGTTSWNYAYIPDWGRYYFVTDYTTDKGGKLTAHLSIDVLYTYRDSIKASDVTVVRWSGAGINYVHDDKLPVWQTRTKKRAVNLTPIQGGGYLPASDGNILIGLI